MRLLLLVVAAAAATAVGAVAANDEAYSFCRDTSGGRWVPTWGDEFDGDALDTSVWSNKANGCRLATCDLRNAHVRDGKLVLVSRRHGPNNYTSAAIETRGVRQWSHWPGFRVCVRARLPGNASAPHTNAGVWPAHWMLPDHEDCDPDYGEIDILEMVSGKGTAWSTYHWQNSMPEHPCRYPQNHSEVAVGTVLTAWSERYVEYAVEHTGDYIAYVINGIVVLNVTSGDDRDKEPMFWPRPFYLILNTAVGGGWPGPPNDNTTFPLYHYIDYVRSMRPAGAPDDGDERGVRKW